MLPPLPDPLPPVPFPFPPVPTPLPSPLPQLPLPLPIPDPRISFPPIHFRSLRCGCYLINYTPQVSIFNTYDGTMRVECHSNGRTASGDLYQRNFVILPPTPVPLPRPPFIASSPRIILANPPSPTGGIPIFPRSRSATTCG